MCPSQGAGVAQRLILLRCNRDLESPSTPNHGRRFTASPYLVSTPGPLRGRCASRCSSCLGWEPFRQCIGQMYDREVRSENSRQIASNKRGTGIGRRCLTHNPGVYQVYNHQPRTRVQSLGHVGKRYTRQTPTKNDLFQGTVPVFGISTREIPVNTKVNPSVFFGLN